MKNYNNLHNDLFDMLLATITAEWQSYKSLKHSIDHYIRISTGWEHYKITLHVLAPALLHFDSFYPLEWKKEKVGGNTIYFVRLKGNCYECY